MPELTCDVADSAIENNDNYVKEWLRALNGVVKRRRDETMTKKGRNVAKLRPASAQGILSHLTAND